MAKGLKSLKVNSARGYYNREKNLLNVKQHIVNRSPRDLAHQIQHHLNGNGLATNWGVHANCGKIKGFAVLFLLTQCRTRPDGPYEPCLLLNKRSRKVLQPGDLCCPGGGIERLDKVLSQVLHLPLSPLRRWPYWHKWKSMDRKKSRGLALLLATALREGWEEMRLNPLKVDFLGPLPVQNLVMFDRQIYPLVGWMAANQRLVPNWEVERIVHIPLRRLFDRRHYARYRLRFETRQAEIRCKEDYPCFMHHGRKGDEILWGATFRLTMDFLNLVFGFELPDLSSSRVIEGLLGETYFNGP